MQQTGLLGDESGVVKFIVWKGESDTLLEQDQVYTIRYGAVDEYNGRLTITVDPASCTRQDEADIEVVSRQGAEEEVCDRFEGRSSPLSRLSLMQLLNPVLSRHLRVRMRLPYGQMQVFLRLNRVDGMRLKG